MGAGAGARARTQASFKFFLEVKQRANICARISGFCHASQNKKKFEQRMAPTGMVRRENKPHTFTNITIRYHVYHQG
jgi:hypothetical protein